MKLGHNFITAVSHDLITQHSTCQCNHTLPSNLH